MPRPEYPSDEKRRKNKPAVRVHHSVESHPRMAAIYGDNDLLATWLRIMIASSKAHIGKTGDRLTITRSAAAPLGGRETTAGGRRHLLAVAAALSWEVRETPTSITIGVRNFARKQGFDSAACGVVAEHALRTPHPSESESESESKRTDSVPTERPESPIPNDVIWKIGVPLLRAAGTAESTARSFLASMSQLYGSTALAETLAHALSEKPVEPRAWIVASLKARGKNGSYPASSKSPARPAVDWEAERVRAQRD